MPDIRQDLLFWSTTRKSRSNRPVMVVRSTHSRIKRYIRRSIYYLKSTSIVSAFRGKSKPRSIIRSLIGNRSEAPVLRPISFFDTSVGINPELIKTHACELLIGYQFKEPLLLWEALQALGTAYDMPQMPRYDDGNTRLAIVGDRVLDLLLALKWYPTWQPRGTHRLNKPQQRAY